MKEVKNFVEDGLHPRIIIAGLRKSCTLALAKLEEIAVSQEGDKFRHLLEKCAGTALNSKLIARQKHLFAPMVVDAVMYLINGDAANSIVDLKLVGIKKIVGGSVTDSFMVQGVAFKKTFSYAGFEQQPKHLSQPKLLILNVELELKSEKENAEVRITDPDQYQSIVDAEWSIIYEKLDKCVASGAKVVLSRLPIGDLATQYFADRGIFCAGRVSTDDLERVQKATGACVQTSIHDITEDVLGFCESFEERGVGDERYNFFTGCPKAKTATIILRGGGEQFLDETDRSIHDALMVVKRSLTSRRVVAGGGAIEMELSKTLRDVSRTIMGKQQLIMNAFARALEVIPRALSENAGIDSTDVLNRLRKEHATAPGGSGKWFGVDVTNEGICDTFESGVWEPAANKLNSLAAATEAACCILSIDETVRNPQSEKAGQGMPTQGQNRKMVSEAMGGGGMAGMMGSGVRKGAVRKFKGKGGA